jgi:hypothetical protein
VVYVPLPEVSTVVLGCVIAALTEVARSSVTMTAPGAPPPPIAEVAEPEVTPPDPPEP